MNTDNELPSFMLIHMTLMKTNNQQMLALYLEADYTYLYISMQTSINNIKLHFVYKIYLQLLMGTKELQSVLL